MMAAALGFLLLGGCTYLREAIGLGPQRPTVTLAEIDVDRVSLVALDLTVVLRVNNPNNFALDFAKLRYDVKAAGLDVAAGTYDDKISIPASGNSFIKLPLKVDTVNALKLVHELLTKGDDVLAVMNATADFATPLGAMQVSFEDKKPLRKLTGL